MADRNRLESGRWQRCQPRVRIPPPLPGHGAGSVPVTETGPRALARIGLQTRGRSAGAVRGGGSDGKDDLRPRRGPMASDEHDAGEHASPATSCSSGWPSPWTPRGSAAGSSTSPAASSAATPGCWSCSGSPPTHARPGSRRSPGCCRASTGRGWARTSSGRWPRGRTTPRSTPSCSPTGPGGGSPPTAARSTGPTGGCSGSSARPTTPPGSTTPPPRCARRVSC